MAQDIQYDVDGYKVLSEALQDLLNMFPALDTGEEISFSTIGNEEGIAFFPTYGAVIQSERKDVTGYTEQTCVYPFMVMLKGSGLSQRRRLNAKEWLDMLGEWLERKEIELDGIKHQLKKYPPLNGTRTIDKIVRVTPAYLSDTTDDKVDSWVININLNYKNNYKEI